VSGKAPKLPFQLERREDRDDGAGGVVSSWATHGVIWGVLSTRRGRERVSGAAGVSQATHTVRVRGTPYDAPSRPSVRDRLRLGNRVFEIVSVVEADPLGRQLDCHVIEEVAA